MAAIGRPQGSKNKTKDLPFTFKDIQDHYKKCKRIANKEADKNSFDNLWKLLCWEADRFYGKPKQEISAEVSGDLTISVNIGEKSID